LKLTKVQQIAKQFYIQLLYDFWICKG